MAKKKIAVIMNPNAGKSVPRGGLGKMIGSILTTSRWVYSTETLKSLKSAQEEIRRTRPDIVVYVGGDGSVHHGINELLKAPPNPLPQILVMPVGTMNDVGSSLGLTQYPAEQLADLGLRRYPVEVLAERIAAKVKAGEPLDHVHLRPLRINDRYGFLYGSGMSLRMLQKYYADERRGPRRALKVVLNAAFDELLSLATFRLRKPTHGFDAPIRARITIPGSDIVAPDVHTAILVGAVEQIGVGCRALPDARRKPGCFMLRATNLSFWETLMNARRVWSGQQIPDTFDAVVPEIRIEYAEPTPTTIDGEVIPPNAVDVIRSGPVLSFITG